MNLRKTLFGFMAFGVVVLLLLMTQSSIVRAQRGYAFNPGGTWFGNALPNDPTTSPFPEVVMIPTFLPDGTVIANDSQEYNNPHSPAKGVWTMTDRYSIQAVFIWIQEGTAAQGFPNGYAGAIKIRLRGSVTPPATDNMQGTLVGTFFPPGTDPLDPTDKGGVGIGTFTIQSLRRVRLQ